MSHHCLIGIFASEKDLMAAVRGLRYARIAISDIQTPYAIHGLDEAAGLRRSRLGWVCAVAGLSAAIGMLGFQLWVSVAAWPINVGGKPFASIPAFVPVMFEVGILTAGLTTVFAFLLVSRLFPWKRPSLAHPGVTDDRFAIIVEAAGAGPETARAEELYREHNAVDVVESSGGGR